jgi:hypothetical protein
MSQYMYMCVCVLTRVPKLIYMEENFGDIKVLADEGV